MDARRVGGAFLRVSVPARRVAVQQQEGACKPSGMSLVLDHPPEVNNGSLSLPEIRRSIRRIAALLQQQAPELFTEKRANQQLFAVPSECQNQQADDHVSIDVFITDSVDSLHPPQEPGLKLPAIPSHKLPRRSGNTRVGTTQRKLKLKVGQLKSCLSSVAEGPDSATPETAADSAWRHPRDPRSLQPVSPSDAHKPAPNAERLKSLVSRDFSKPPPAHRQDPRQQRAKPKSKRKPPDVFKTQVRVKVIENMNDVISMTNYGELHIPEPVQGKSTKARKDGKEDAPKKPYKVPRELQPTLAVPRKLPPISRRTPPAGAQTPPLSPTPDAPNVGREGSFTLLTDQFSDELGGEEGEGGEEGGGSLVSAHADPGICTCGDPDPGICTCGDYTGAEHVGAEAGAGSATLVEVCAQCGGRRPFRGHSGSAQTGEESLVFSSRLSTDLGDEALLDAPTQSCIPLEPTPWEVSPEDVILNMEMEIESLPPPLPSPPLPSPPLPPSPETDITAAIEAVGAFRGILDPETEEQPIAPRPVSRTVLAPIKRQKGVYPGGAREAYIKALAAAEVARLPPNWWQMLGPRRISHSWVFSYYDYIELPSTKEPATIPPSLPTQSHPTPATLTVKRKKKKFKPIKHIFGKIKPDDYFPGMKKNMILSPIRISGQPGELPDMVSRQPLGTSQEETAEGSTQSQSQLVGDSDGGSGNLRVKLQVVSRKNSASSESQGFMTSSSK